MGTTNFDSLEVNSITVHEEYSPEAGNVAFTGNISATGSVTGATGAFGNTAITGNIAASGEVAGATGEFGKIALTGVSAIATADATSTASTQTVDPTEFAAVVALLNACKAKINAIIAGT